MKFFIIIGTVDLGDDTAGILGVFNLNQISNT